MPEFAGGRQQTDDNGPQPVTPEMRDACADRSPYDSFDSLSDAAAGVSANPDLRCYTPLAWDGPIVVSNTPGTRTQSQPTAGQPAYIDWAVTNSGGIATSARFYVRILVDGTQVANWYVDPPLNVNWYVHVDDFQREFSEPGDHTVRLEIDYTDQIVESNGSNNTCEYIVNVLPSPPELTCYRPSGWTGSIVVSNQTGTHTDSDDLLAGQTAYIDWALINDGDSATSATFYSRLLIDEVEIGSWQTDPPLNGHWYTMVQDIEYTFATPGNHTVRLEIDYTDQVAEPYESNNECEYLVIAFSPDPGGTPILDSSLELVQVRNGLGIEQPWTLAAEDFDGDENLDLVFGYIFNYLSNDCLGVAFGDGDGGFSVPVYLDNGLGVAVGAAFVDDDPLPDIISFVDGEIHVFTSRGDRTFNPAIVTSAGSNQPIGFATGYINDDQYVDLVTTDAWTSGSKAEVFLGNGDGTFTTLGSPFSSFQVLSIGLADMNNDGNADAIVGGRIAAVFLGDGTGNFSLEDSVVLTGSTLNLQSSFRGNIVDFNEDSHADFVITYPAAGVTNNHARVLFGDGTGHILGSQVVLPLIGIAYPVAVLDYNYDDHLDIAVGSSEQRWIYIFEGDGSGGFTHARSLAIYPVSPLSLIAADYRQDGRWDFISGDPYGSVYALLNTDPPLPVIDSQIVSFGMNTVQLRVTNPPSLQVSALGSSIAGARIGDRDVDSNGVLDQQISDLNLQNGTYKYDIWLRPGEEPGGNYTLGIGIDGHQVRYLARNASAPAPGDTFHFQFPIGNGLEVDPPTGALASSPTPTFDWSQVATTVKRAVNYGFELDDYWDFATPLISRSDLVAPQYTAETPLPPDSLLYWRHRTFDGTTWSEYSPVYAVITPPECACPLQSDFDEDGFLTALDLGEMIDILFAGKTNVQDPGCPSPRADFDCDSFSTALDLGELIDHLFAGDAGPCDPCSP